MRNRRLHERENEKPYIFDEWGMDAHSANYLYVYEIMDSYYYKMSDSDLDDLGLGTYFFRDVVDIISVLFEGFTIR